MVRKELGIRAFNLPELYKRKVRLTVEQRYEELLEPYLVTAFNEADWPVKFTPRLLLAVKLHKSAVDKLRQEHGIVDPRTTNPDIIAIMGRLASSEIVEAHIEWMYSCLLYTSPSPRDRG